MPITPFVWYSKTCFPDDLMILKTARVELGVATTPRVLARSALYIRED